ncbi:very short patch repair endonuclease [[Pseudomonas] boreopolis]
MRRIRGKDTRPELVVRSAVHRMGFRFRLHQKDLPGNPDVVLPKHKKVIMVHGCFWHGHRCEVAHQPKSNTAYWTPKIERNRARDFAVRSELAHRGWKVLEVWECETRDLSTLREKLGAFLLG